MLAITRKVDQWVQIGQSIAVAPTDIDEKTVRLIARGRVIGGAEDGAAFERTAELSVGGEMRLGEHVVVAVLAIAGDEVRLGVQSPKHVRVGRKERADQKWSFATDGAPIRTDEEEKKSQPQMNTDGHRLEMQSWLFLICVHPRPICG
jgi:sRNA-binding carbon storage regulator CsrA